VVGKGNGLKARRRIRDLSHVSRSGGKVTAVLEYRLTRCYASNFGGNAIINLISEHDDSDDGVVFRRAEVNALEEYFKQPAIAVPPIA